jgi:hypothetical protein
MRFYITQETKEEIEAEIELYEHGSYAVSSMRHQIFADCKAEVYKEILANSVVLPTQTENSDYIGVNLDGF